MAIANMLMDPKWKGLLPFGLLMYALNLIFIGPIVLSVFSVLTEIDIPKRCFPSLKDGGMILNSVRMIHNVMSWYEIWRLSAGA